MLCPVHNLRGKAFSLMLLYILDFFKINVPYVEDIVLYYFSSNMNMNAYWNLWNTLLYRYKSCDFTSAACSYRLLWFVNIEPVLYSWNNHHLVMMYTCTCYKFPFQWCVSYIPQILMYFHSVQCIFKLSLEIIQYSKVCCLVPKYLEILSFCYWFLVWFL